MVSFFFIFAVFILGLFIGSFLNVLIDRLPRGEKITGRSYCESCKKTLTWKDLVPLLSFIYLKGKCRYCSARFSYQYPILEFMTGLMFVATYTLTGGIFNFQFSIFNEIINHNSSIINLFYYLFIVSCLIVIFFADLRYGIIPDKILFPAILVTSIFYLFSSPVAPVIFNHLSSAIGTFLFFLFIYLITKAKGMGFGDVKLAFVIGLILGFPGTILALYIAFLTGGFVGFILILWKKVRLNLAVPFGPFLVVGTLISLFFADRIILKIIPLLF